MFFYTTESVPEAFDKTIPMADFEFGYVVLDEKSDVCYVFFERLPADLGHVVHLDVKRFGPKLLKDLKRIWEEEILPDAIQRGCTTLRASFDREDETKWKKFIKHFGFDNPVRVYLATREV